MVVGSIPTPLTKEIKDLQRTQRQRCVCGRWLTCRTATTNPADGSLLGQLGLRLGM